MEQRAQHVRSLGKTGAIVVLVGESARQDQHHLIQFPQRGFGERQMGSGGRVEATGKDSQAGGLIPALAQELH